jgi:hypothetical protein
LSSTVECAQESREYFASISQAVCRSLDMSAAMADLAKVSMATQRRLLSKAGPSCLCGPDIRIGSRAGRLKLTLGRASADPPEALGGNVWGAGRLGRLNQGLNER